MPALSVQERFIANGFLTLNESTEAWARLTPFHYYLGNDPLVAGLNWVDAAVLAGLAAIGFVASLSFFERRDLTSRG